jgi:hypothetical protein
VSDPANDLAQLRADLAMALAIEHATVPPYLAAWASVDDASTTNRVARSIIRSVFTEEMLHMTQVANLLLAVGGTPHLAHAGFVPTYPHSLPGAAPGWTVSIAPLSSDTLDDFMRIELPQAPGSPHEEDGWHTIGQFYAGVLDRYRAVLAEFPGLLAENIDRQIQPGAFYGAAPLLAITSIDDVERAVTSIVTQGEGNPGSVFDRDPSLDGSPGFEPAHYDRFLELKAGRRFQQGDSPTSGPTGAPIPIDETAIRPMRTNATFDDYAGHPDVVAVLTDFNIEYGRLLQSFELAFGGATEAFHEATAQMFAVGRMAEAIVRMPDPTSAGSTVGLVFDPIFDL